MKKKLALLPALILLLTVLASCSAPDTKGYKVQTVPVTWNDLEVGSFDLRYYNATPHVPYYGMKAYLAFMRGEELTITAEEGSWTATDPVGTQITVDPAAGTITAPDWDRFRYPMIGYKAPEGIRDPERKWCSYTETVYEEDPATVVFDLAKYGLTLYADEDDIWMPLGLLSTMLPGGEQRHAVFNGEKVILAYSYTSVSVPASFYKSKRMMSLLEGNGKREEDEIREDYGELCFIIDYFFGYPGASALDPVIRERGLDETLKARAGDTRKQLLSSDLAEFMTGLLNLTGRSLEDGHTGFSGIMGIYEEEDSFPAVKLKLSKVYRMTPSKGQAIETIMEGIRETRAAAWGEDTYRECGSTAIIRIDSFNPDDDAWEAFYAGEGDLPQDSLGAVFAGLKRASENPAIRNVLFDVTANGGGSTGMVTAIVDLAFGDNLSRAYQVLTGQHYDTYGYTDKNLDGVIDEKDDEVKYDFNYAVLTSRASFSCGNLFPVRMQEHGAVLIGEPSGGGSCCLQFSTLSGGMEFMMSTCDAALQTKDGESIEDGCRTDIPIARIEPEKATHPKARLSNGDYSPFFDDEALDRMINEWFEEMK